MVWLFEREFARLRCEIRREMDGAGYEVAVAGDVEEDVVHVHSPTVLIERSQEVWSRLLAEGWQPARSGNGTERLRRCTVARTL